MASGRGGGRLAARPVPQFADRAGTAADDDCVRVESRCAADATGVAGCIDHPNDAIR